MTFPLEGETIEIISDVKVGPDLPITKIPAPSRVDWTPRIDGPFPDTIRNISAIIGSGPLINNIVTKITAERSWNGVGGIKYLPSFPQLDSTDTAFPDAL